MKKGDTEGARAEIRRRVRRGRPVKREDIARRFGVSEIFVREAAGIEQDHWRSEQQPKPSNANVNGKTPTKRIREIQEEKKQGSDYLKLWDLQVAVARMCQLLQGYDVARDCEVDEVVMWRLTDLLDDLTDLQAWLDRATSAVQGRMDDAPQEQLIAKLRNVAGRTPDEIAAFKRAADRLERRLRNRLASSAR